MNQRVAPSQLAPKGTKPIRVLVLFGGKSGEHSISCATAAGVLANMDRSRFEPVPVGITLEGEWVLLEDDPAALAIKDGQGATVQAQGSRVCLEPGSGELLLSGPEGQRKLGKIDVVMPLLHGPYGEDGTIQGLCEMVGLPYTGCGVLASAAAMHKGTTKTLLAGAGIEVGQYVVYTKSAWRSRSQAVPAEVAHLGLPVFVKPCRAGSSLGVSKVEQWEDLEMAVAQAQQHDPTVIIEAMNPGREIECGVLQGRRGDAPRPAWPGEIVMVDTPGMYDFESKYYAQGAVQLQVPAQIPEPVSRQIQDIAARAFTVLECEGLARVDFFYNEQKQTIVLNEVNTMPGMTPFSLFPKMWENMGMSYSQLVSELLDLALERPTGLR